MPESETDDTLNRPVRGSENYNQTLDIIAATLFKCSRVEWRADGSWYEVENHYSFLSHNMLSESALPAIPVIRIAAFLNAILFVRDLVILSVINIASSAGSARQITRRVIAITLPRRDAIIGCV